MLGRSVRGLVAALPLIRAVTISPVGAAVSPIAAALFDFDGTLSPSEDTHRRTFAKVLGMEDEMDWEFWESNCVGHAPPDIIRKYRRPEISASVEELVEVRAGLFEEAIERGELPLTGGTVELLHELRESGVRCAVVTSGPRSYIEKALRKLGVESCFEVVVTGTDDAVQGRLKPDPFPFLHAAALLGVEPERCLAFEDSMTGINSARGAGMPVVVVAANINKEAQPGSDGILERVDEFSCLSVADLTGKVAELTGRVVPTNRNPEKFDI